MGGGDRMALTTKYVKVQSRPHPSSLVGHSSNPGWHGNLATHFSCTKHDNHARCTITMKRSGRLVSLICLRDTPISWQIDSISIRFRMCDAQFPLSLFPSLFSVDARNWVAQQQFPSRRRRRLATTFSINHFAASPVANGK